MGLSFLPVSYEAFTLVQSGNVNRLNELSAVEVRAILPYLVRTTLCVPMDDTASWDSTREKILETLVSMEPVNNIVAFLSVDYHMLEQDTKKELYLKQKQGIDSILKSDSVNSGSESCIMEFERGDYIHKLRLIQREAIILTLMGKRVDLQTYENELLDSLVYQEEVSDSLCICQAELPTVLAMEQLVEGLLRLADGAVYISRLVANSPDVFRKVVAALVANAEPQSGEDELLTRRRSDAIRCLCRMNPSERLTVRDSCVQKRKLASLVILLSLDHRDSVDLVGFISGLLLGSAVETRQWFCNYIRGAQKGKPSPSGAHEHPPTAVAALASRLVDELTSLTSSLSLHGSALLAAVSVLRLYASLRGFANWRFPDTEANLLFTLATMATDPSPAVDRFISVSLAFLLACPFVINTTAQERATVVWLRELIIRSSATGHMLLLLAIHFHSNHTTSIVELICSTLGMRIPVRTASLARLKTMFTVSVFTESVIASHAVTVPSTGPLTAHRHSLLPIHCMLQLLRSRTFARHGVAIQPWIYAQINQSRRPLHPLLTPLIDAFVNSVLGSRKAGSHAFRQAFTEGQIESTVRCYTAGGALTPALLILYYCLLYKEVLQTNARYYLDLSVAPVTYSPRLYSSLPIKLLLGQIKAQQHDYSNLYPPTLRLLSKHYPDLCLVLPWSKGCHGNTVDGGKPSPEELEAALGGANPPLGSANPPLWGANPPLGGANPTRALLALQGALLAPNPEPYRPALLRNLRRALVAGTPRRLADSMCDLWRRLYAGFPRRTGADTVNALRVASHTYSQEDLTRDPLVVLSVAPPVFRCPPLLSCLLTVLEASLTSSDVQFASHCQLNPVAEVTGGLPSSDDVILTGATNGASKVSSEQEREELRSALSLATYSASIQLLLEACLPGPECGASPLEAQGAQQLTDPQDGRPDAHQLTNPQDGRPNAHQLSDPQDGRPNAHQLTDPQDGRPNAHQLTDLREVQGIVCSFIHQRFIAQPMLAKLIHFQGYSSALLPVTVPGIASMHICLDFIPELLGQPHPDKQLFGIQLISHLCVQYALPTSLSAARLAINVCSTLLTVLTSSSRPQFFTSALPALARMCDAFPVLCSDVTSLLLQLGQITTADIADRRRGGVLAPSRGEYASQLDNSSALLQQVKEIFSDILDSAIINKIGR